MRCIIIYCYLYFCYKKRNNLSNNVTSAKSLNLNVIKLIFYVTSVLNSLAAYPAIPTDNVKASTFSESTISAMFFHDLILY